MTKKALKIHPAPDSQSKGRGVESSKIPEGGSSRRNFAKKLLAWLVFIALIVALAVLRYGYNSFFPAPIVISPEFEDEEISISSEGAFKFSFGQRMKRETVEKAIAINPNIPYESDWEGKTLFLRPSIALRKGDIYRISIENTAKSFFGKKLIKPYYFTFKVGEKPRIVEMFPAPGVINPNEKIIIIFSDPMISEPELPGNVQPDFLELNPPVEGRWIWHDSKTLVFHPRGRFDLATRYQLKNTRPIESYDSTVLKDKIDLVFETDRLKLIDPLLIETQENLPATDRVLIHNPFEFAFNQPVNRTELMQDLRLTNASGRAIEDLVLTESEDDPARYQIRRKNGDWYYDEEYSLHFSENLRPAEGNLNLGEDLTVLYRTEDIIRHNEKVIGYDMDTELLISDNIIDIDLVERIPLSQLKDSIHFVPETLFEIKKSGTNSYQISLGEYSQKRENIKMYITDGINGEEKKYVSKAIVRTIKVPEDLLVTAVDEEDKVCVHSNYPLKESSSFELIENEQRSSYLLEDVQNSDDCVSEADLAYQYLLHKKYLAPNVKKTFTLNAEDIYGQKISKEISIRTAVIDPSRYMLDRKDQFFYQTYHDPADLYFDYSSKNLSKLRIQVCKVSTELALRIESRYQEKWFSFAPAAGKCLKYKPLIQDIDVSWGESQDHRLILSDLLDEITPGLYYIYIHAPNLSNEDGDPVETNIVLQYSDWNILSKRGDSSLVWLTDHKTGQAIPEATVKLISSEGSILEIAKTDSDGRYFLEDSRLKHEYILVEKDGQEALLNVFAQEGFEASAYSVAFNYNENKYLYQFYLEDPSRKSNEINGVFILKERGKNAVMVSEIKTAIIALYDANEDILWREYVDLDEFGNLYFKINPRFPLLDGNYSLSVCAGLHQGVCHGTNFWTNIQLGAVAPALTRSPASNDGHGRESEVISVRTTGIYQPGDKLEIELSNLEKGRPVLLTLERDAISKQQVLYPDSSEYSLEIEITEEMIPEIIITVTQYQEDELLYDMKVVNIDRSSKKIGEDRQGEISRIVFETGSQKLPEGDYLLNAFYPNLGTSIITASSSRPKQADEVTYQSPINTVSIGDTVLIDGDLVFPGDKTEENDGYSKYIMLHDKEGNFDNLVVKAIDKTPDISIAAGLPKFIRPRDQIIFDLLISNNSNQNKNLQLFSTAEDLEFISGRGILFGLQAGGVANIDLASKAGSFKNKTALPLELTVLEEGEVLASLNVTIPIMHLEQTFKKKKNIIYQQSSSEGSLIMPIKSAGLWKRKTFIATSPISFVLENLKGLLEKESIQIDEVIMKSALVADYSTLLKSSLSEEDELFALLDSKRTYDNELYYLELHQKNDGGWSRDPDATVSDPMLTSWIAKALSVLFHNDYELPEDLLSKAKKYLKEQLDELVNRRIREEIDPNTLSDAEVYQEMLLLNALSSLTPSGISYANSWYTRKDTLSNEALVLLLLSFEDYRDANVSATNFKIEELIQLLKARREIIRDQIWLEKRAEAIPNLSDFIISSWYLEALVRQASAHSDIPPLITWLVDNKYTLNFQTPAQQFSFLHSMNSYLRIFQESITAKKIRLVINNQKKYDFDIQDIQKFKSYSIVDYFRLEEDEEAFQSLSFSTDTEQALFIEVSLEKDDAVNTSSQGLSIYLEFRNPGELKKGDVIEGRISIISPRQYENLVVIHPQIAAADFKVSAAKTSVSWKTKIVGPQEKWYIFDKLEAGETVIPFEGIVTSAGVFQTPAIYAYLYEQPEIHAVSNSIKLEIRK